MISLTEFFRLNQEIIYFIYGLGFFILGFAIILQSRRSSRLELARSLRWLAAFGITHAFNEWGDLFIPIQARYLSPLFVKLLFVIQLLLLAVSFACLFEFGISVLRPFNGATWMRGVPAFLLTGWGFLVFFILLPNASDLRAWDRAANALSRYFIGFPGGLMAAYGLRVHAIRRIKPLDVPVIFRTLRVAGVSLGIYALLGGLINTEHERLARELHDGAIQKVYTAGLLVESAARLTPRETELASRLERSVIVLNDAIADLRQNLAELHQEAPSSDISLIQSLHRLADDLHYNTLVNISLDVQLPEEKSLSPVRTGHLIAILNETLANIVRHAKARNVRVQAYDLGEKLQISIKDDGVGFSPSAQPGYGLRNMRDRSRLLNGELHFSEPSNKWTTVTVEVPWVD